MKNSKESAQSQATGSAGVIDSSTSSKREAVTMEAMVQERYGTPSVVLRRRQVKLPVPADDEVLVQVKAAGISIGDWLVISGLPYFARFGYGLTKPKSRTPGFEVCGVVDRVGRKVNEFQPGDEVFGWCQGGLAEYVAVSESALASKPANVTVEQAAVVPNSGMAALQALRDTGGVKSGQRVMVIGASGGVGTYAVQIAKALGAVVTGVCSTKSVEVVRSIGANDVIDYTRHDPTKSGTKFDLIIDLAGKNRLTDLRRTLSDGGTLVMVGGSGGRWTMGIGRTLRGVLMSPFVSQNLKGFLSKPGKSDLRFLKDLMEAGKLVPVIDKIFPLEKTTTAIGYIERRSTQGKTLISVGPTH